MINFCFSILSITLITNAVVAPAVLPAAIPKVDLISNYVYSEAWVENFIAISFPSIPPA